MNWALRQYRLIKLRLLCWKLRAEFDHAEALMADHKQRYLILAKELRANLRRLDTLESPETILKRAA